MSIFRASCSADLKTSYASTSTTTSCLPSASLYVSLQNANVEWFSYAPPTCSFACTLAARDTCKVLPMCASPRHAIILRRIRILFCVNALVLLFNNEVLQCRVHVHSHMLLFCSTSAPRVTSSSCKSHFCDLRAALVRQCALAHCAVAHAIHLLCARLVYHLKVENLSAPNGAPFVSASNASARRRTLTYNRAYMCVKTPRSATSRS